ncbi:hypothetical protein [Sphingomonas sp. LH128]|uniref:hypothetical protein n=1 Tax=Sphingomonas sp. LH128 TaxID=473781 RepID=UPI00155E41C2|nr:hypothetical protein [Sphingomonas sp. LH128]
METAPYFELIQALTNSPPGILAGSLPSEDLPCYLQIIYPNDTTNFALVARGDITVSTNSWFKTAAKVAHGFAVANLGIEALQPMVHNWIIGLEPVHGTYWVGTAGPYEASEALHTMRLFEATFWAPQRQRFEMFYIVEVRLFANMPSHIYTVVVGTKPLRACA